MNPKTTVTQMLRSYPSLYPTRVTALLHLFDSTETIWKDGELIHTDPTMYERNNYLDDETADQAAYEKALHTDRESDMARDLLFTKRENARKRFVHDNAALLAADTSSNFRKGRAIDFKGRRFDDIPEDVKPEWLEAAKEVAFAVLAHKFINLNGYNAEYAQRFERELEQSKRVCTQFLERFKVVQICQFARAARIAELQREAAALGLSLVDPAMEKA